MYMILRRRLIFSTLALAAIVYLNGFVYSIKRQPVLQFGEGRNSTCKDICMLRYKPRVSGGVDAFINFANGSWDHNKFQTYAKRKITSGYRGRNALDGRWNDGHHGNSGSGNGLMSRLWRSLTWMFSGLGQQSDVSKAAKHKQFTTRFVPISMVSDKFNGYNIKAATTLANSYTAPIEEQETLDQPENPYNSLVLAQPSDILSSFADRAPIRVREAVRKIISQLTGSVGKFCIETMLITTPDRLAMLLNNLQMTGYLLWNAEYRYSLCQELNFGTCDKDKAPSAHEQDINKPELQDTLFQFVKTLPDEIVYGLVENVSVPVVDAMRRSVDATIDALTNGAARQTSGSTVCTHLHTQPRVLVQQTGSSTLHLCFWHLALGYWFRDLEVKLDLSSALDS